MSELDNVAPGGVVQLQNSPAGLDDATFDSLFPTDGTSQVTPQSQSGNQPVGTKDASQTQNGQGDGQPNADQPYLKGAKSVYKTVDAAIEGVNQKDALIEQLRTRYALTTGVDPITGQPVGQQYQPQVDPNDYRANPQKYMDDLYAAAKAGPNAYANVQEKFIMDALKPLAPVMTQAARSQALEVVAKDNSEAAKFIGTPAYQKALEANPDLQGAIQSAEADYRFHSRLPGLYKLAHLAGQGMQLPELLRANAQTNTTQQQVRTSVPARTLQPPTTPASTPNMKDIKGIRATIAEMEAKGAKLEF